MKLAAQLYTVREFTKTPEDVKKTFEKIKNIGYNAVQVSAFGPIEPILLKEYAEQFDLKICATHTPFDRIINDTENVIKEHKLWDCRYVGLGAMGSEYRANKEGYDRLLNELSPAVEKIYDEGLKFVYHNHNFEFEKIDAKLTGIEYLAEKTDPKKFGFLADFFWIQAGGASPIEFIQRYASRLNVVHFKDMQIRNLSQRTAEIFEGNMDYKAIYEECQKNGVEWVAIEQDNCDKDPFESLKVSFENLKSAGMFL